VNVKEMIISGSNACGPEDSEAGALKVAFTPNG
jgi:hypothetical protein